MPLPLIVHYSHPLDTGFGKVDEICGDIGDRESCRRRHCGISYRFEMLYLMMLLAIYVMLLLTLSLQYEIY